MNGRIPDNRGPYDRSRPANGSRTGSVPPRRQAGVPRPETVVPEEKQPETLLEKINGWRLGISIEIEPIIRGLVCLLLISFFALLQTTLFARFRPFGAVPDLLLPLVVAISMTIREKWGAVSGLAAAFIIESLGGATVTILPLLYMPTGYLCGLLTIYYFRNGLAVRAMYTGVTTLARCLFTLIIIYMSSPSVNLPAVLLHITLPEFVSTAVFSFLPHLAVRYAFRLTEGKKIDG
ncbi:MAG: hypothetical protein IKY52_14680 [Clostridia bacterium]|nr:hypothetical protein [Clostridia bacterium]